MKLPFFFKVALALGGKRILVRPLCIRFALLMDGDHAWALAQLCRRFSRNDAMRLSDQHDNGVERDHMLAAVRHVASALEKQGIKPR